ncbi:hypothetical protein Tco_0369955 [Tanacetum coccineum]
MLVTDQLESEVLVRSSKEANTSHAVAANLSELKLKKILIDKMEANNSINRSDILDAYKADEILLDTYGDTVTIKRPRDRADDDQEPSAGTDRGSKRRRSEKEPESTSASREKTTTKARKTTTGSMTHKQSASQSALVEETMQSTEFFEAPAHQEFETAHQSASIGQKAKTRRIMREFGEICRFNTTAGNPVKKILLKLNLSDHRIFKDGGGVIMKAQVLQRSFRHSDTARLSRSDEVLKLKNFKKDATLKLSKSMAQENYVEGCSMQRPPLLEANDKDYYNNNHVRKFLQALPLRWQLKVTVIEEAKDLAELPLDELTGNLKVFEMVLRNDGVISKSTKEKVKSLALKAKFTSGQTSNDSLFKKSNWFKRENCFGNGGDRFDRGHGDRSKGVGSSRRERNYYGYGSNKHFVDDCQKAKEKKAFVGGALSDSDDGD